MKNIFFASLLILMTMSSMSAQDIADKKLKQDIYTLIDNYSLAREKQDTVLLKSILTTDVDQLVSTGEWRFGIKGSMSGMSRSTAGNPGTRKLIIERIRFFSPGSAIVDARYEIQNTDGTTRKMWSTFVVIQADKTWKITAIRNMLPTTQP